MEINCPLCRHQASPFYNDERHAFNHCPNCHGIFRDSEQFLLEKEEKTRYLNHQSSMDDEGYYTFISPIISAVEMNFPKGSAGLDFGCGHTPILSRHLNKLGFDVQNYDPIFFKDKEVLKKQYDFIVSCEVIEHFFEPYKEFVNLSAMLKPRGKLICKTHPYEPNIVFANWYYKNDPSHVFIYQNGTFDWIRSSIPFKTVKVDGRLITFSK